MKRLLNCLPLLLIPLLLAGCAPGTKITNTWTAPDLQPLQLQKVLVVAATRKAGKKDLFENAFVKEFEKHGVRAIPSTEILPKDAEATRETVLNAIKGADIDAVLVMEIKEEEVYTPPHFTHTPNGYMAHMVHTPVVMTEPGYFSTLVTVLIDTTLYETQGGQPLWSAISETQDPTSAEELLPGYRKAIMQDLTQKGFIRQMP